MFWNKPAPERMMSPKEEQVVAAQLARWAGYLQTRGLLDRNRAREIIGSAYQAIGLPPPRWFYFAENLSDAFEAVQLITNQRFMLENFGSCIEAGPALDQREFAGRVASASQVLLNSFATLARQISSRLENSRIWTWRMELLAGRLCGTMRELWGNPVFSRDDGSFDLEGAMTKPPAFRRLPIPLTRVIQGDLRLQLRWQGFEEGHYSVDRVRESFEDPSTFFFFPAVMTATCFLTRAMIQFTNRAPLQDLDPLFKLAAHIPAIAPFRDLCVVVDRPEHFHFNLDGFHRDGGAAVVWGPGLKLYCMNGVQVPPWLALTPAAELDPRKLLDERNVNIRREFARKIGIERVLTELGARVVDRRGDYELVILNLGPNRNVPYLKMRNPSVDAWHIEGVEPGIRTVAGALEWRNGTKEKPVVLT